MAYCPVCRGEFVEGIKTCPDCSVELAEQLPPEGPDYEFELLVEAEGEIATRVIKAELDASGIPNVLSGDALGAVHVYPAKDAKIWVPKRHLVQAKEIADQVLSSPPLEEEALGDETYCDSCGAKVPDDAEKCPECGASFEGGQKE